MKDKRIAIIGAGNIARAVVAGLVQFGFNPKQIFVSNPTQQKLDCFNKTWGVNISLCNLTVANQADIIILAVKPATISTVLAELTSCFAQNNKLLVSLAVGASCQQMQRWLGLDQQAIIRAIPNTSSAINTGATGLYANAHASCDDKNVVESLFRATGLTLWVEQEAQIHAVSALAGSGPAYVYLIMEAIQSAGEALGLESASARLLTEQTVLGAAKVALESEQPLTQLRKAVTSPNGTTAAAIAELQQGQIELLMKKALEAANARAEQLTSELEQL